MPGELFRQEQLDYNVMYYQRCCSMYDFYSMLSKDNPCYVDRKERRWGNGLYSSQKAPPWGLPVPSQSERQNLLQSRTRIIGADLPQCTPLVLQNIRPSGQQANPSRPGHHNPRTTLLFKLGISRQGRMSSTTKSLSVMSNRLTRVIWMTSRGNQPTRQQYAGKLSPRTHQSRRMGTNQTLMANRTGCSRINSCQRTRN